jgi:hypothetical protein
MLAVFITLTPGRQNEFIDCQKDNIRIAVLPILDVKTKWNSTMEFLERACQLQEFTHVWLQNPKYSNFQPLIRTNHKGTIVQYVMEVVWLFQYWTLGMSIWHTVTLHHVITVYNHMFDRMDVVM